jgi:hypothetical protein
MLAAFVPDALQPGLSRGRNTVTEESTDRSGGTPAPPRRLGSDDLADKPPLDPLSAAAAVAASVGRVAALLVARRIHLPRANVGRQLRFADGSRATVYRETILDGGDLHDPAVLVVAFRLRVLTGRMQHRLFRIESILNTPLFAGFPGYVSKLWLTHDQRGVYRGVYQWDGAERAEQYARALWRVLALGSVPGSIHYRVLPGMRRDEFLRDPGAFGSTRVATGPDWWRPAEPISVKGRVREPE